MVSFKPVFKRPEDEISKRVEDRVRIGIESKVRSEVDEKLKARVEGVKADVDAKVEGIKARVEGVKAEVDAKVEGRFKEESEKVRGEVDTKVKTEVEARVLAILKEKEERDKSDKASKITKAVDMARALKGESDSEKDKEKAEKEKAEKERSEKETLCPNCHIEGRTGHIHRVETDKSGLIYRCNDGKCGFEAVLVPKNSDYKCVGCGSPIKKPEKEEHAKDMEGCPFCHGTKAIRYDWSKVWNVLKK